MKQPSTITINRIKTALFIACLFPLASLLIAYLTDTFGPDPVVDISHSTGIWSLNLLLATLAITPIRKLTQWNWLVRLRRTIALYAFFYASLHISSYLVFDQFFDWPEIGRDFSKRRYLMAGLASYVLMVPLAITSTTKMMKRLGGRLWQMLHRLTYPVACAAVLHYFWLARLDLSSPSIYAIVLMILFCARLAWPRHSKTHELERPKHLRSAKSA